MENQVNLEALAVKAAEALDLANKATLQAKIDAVLGVPDETLALALSADPVEKPQGTPAQVALLENIGSGTGAFAGVKCAADAAKIAARLRPDPDLPRKAKIAMLKSLFVGIKNASDAALVAKAVHKLEAAQ